MPTPAQRIIWAVRTRKHSRLRDLLQRPGYLTAASPSGRTALHAAAEVGDLGAVCALLEAGADANARTGDGQTPLHRAACLGRDMLPFDDRDGRDPCRFNRRAPTQLAEAALQVIRQRNPDLAADLSEEAVLTRFHVLCGLLDLRAEPTRLLQEFSAAGIELASADPLIADELQGSSRFISVAECLLHHGADLFATTDSGVTPLQFAVASGRTRLVKLLLERGAATPKDMAGPMGEAFLRQALEAAALGTAMDLLELLVQHGASLQTVPEALGDAAFSGSLKLLDWLLAQGVPPDHSDGFGWGPAILSAARNGQPKAILHLLSRGARHNVRDEGGAGLLHCATSWPQSLEVVLPLGLPLEQVNAKGRTPLHCAAQSGTPDGVQMLLQAGANVNAQDHEGATALHLIFESEEFRPDIEFPVFLTLVEAGADLTLRNRAGQTAYDLAVRWNYPAEYLRLLHPDGTGARPGTFLWLGSEPLLKQFLPRADVPIEVNGQKYPSSQAWFEERKRELGPGSRWLLQLDATMQAALRYKFLQRSELKDRLLATGTAHLIADSSVEGCWGGYWTERHGMPFNTLGHLLMKVREELRSDFGAS